MKYFMASWDEDGVRSLDDYKDMIINGEEEEIELFEMKRDIGGEMWCDADNGFISEGDCGQNCEYYEPCNGKNGRCRNLKNGFKRTGRKFLLTKDGLKGVNSFENLPQ